MIAVLAGSTGLVGSIVLQKLLEDQSVTEIICLVRRPMNIQSTKVREVVLKDFSMMENIREDLRGTHYFCALGTTLKAAGSKEQFKKVDHDNVLSFARIAKYHSCESFVLVSAKGASSKSLFFYNRVKGEVETDLVNLSLHRLVIMHPSLLVGERKEFRLGERIFTILLEGLSPIMPKKLRKLLITPAENLAIQMISESKKQSMGVYTIDSQNI